MCGLIDAYEEIEQLAHNNLIAFIPFGSFHSLSSNYSKQTLPSFRHQQLTKMYQQENNLLVYLREFNTLSARDYKFNDLDSAFLFLQMTTYGVAHYLVHSIYSLLQLLAFMVVSLYP
ncbi:hypothetical protein BMR09_16355 [Methylococcaceae bacterium CS3]|nr:hypothetical protein BMR09_16355 [Methylococcaceae bacterium CS3]